MRMVSYAVIATLPDQKVADEYLAWLSEGHVQEVMRGGASRASIVQLAGPPGPVRIETQYLFPDPETFEQYLREHAPRLRADGVAKFGGRSPHQGVSFERREGSVILVLPLGVKPA